MKKYRFNYHFNKIKTQQTGEVHWTVHWRGKCHMVKNIFIGLVPCCTKTNKRQPRGVITGLASKVTIKNGAAYIE